MVFFSKDYNQFFKELAANNNKDWFDANRSRYEEKVKVPFYKFVEHLIQCAKKIEPGFDAEASKCIFRVNRDIRFSKDKTPYKTQLSAVLTNNGKKNMSASGIYFEIGPEAVRIYGGVYMPEKEELLLIRKKIGTQPKVFDKLIHDKKFTSYFGEILGEKSKILSPEIKEIADAHPLIYNKAFYYKAELKPSLVTSDKLDNVLMEHYEAGKPLNVFFTQALKN